MILDITSGSTNPLEKELSNLAQHQFLFHGVKCASMEGFLQALKFDDPAKQIKICSLYGIPAKKSGRERNTIWQKSQTLWWLGREIDRHSNECTILITQAYDELCEQNEDFKNLLLATGDNTLIHSIGEEDPHKTVLTEKEFINQLLRLRSKAQKPA